MEIEKLYVYPIKSMRGVAVETATLTSHGFPYDRCFMILQETETNGAQTFENVSIAPNNETIRFWQDIDYATETLTVTFKPVDGGGSKSIGIPLAPDTSSLHVIDVMMHKSPTQAYKMDAKYNDFMSACFGFDCVLAYIGNYGRAVRMSSLGYKPPASNGQTDGNANSWLSSISSAASKATGIVLGNGADKASEIRFSDVAPYLVVSSKSMEDVRNRLPEGEGEQYDIVKFRPNIIVKGANAVWEEDFWGQLTIAGKSKLECEHNCARCTSINIDYDTGAQGKGEAGSMLKKLAKDRRVDAGAKWNPIFGRYAFLPPNFEGDEIRVGDEVVVSRQNKERTSFGELRIVRTVKTLTALRLRNRLAWTFNPPRWWTRLVRLLLCLSHHRNIIRTIDSHPSFARFAVVPLVSI
jgi:uncharacterized protein YcbX